MKWLALVIALAAVLPVAGWLRRNPRQHPYVWMLIGLSAFFAQVGSGLGDCSHRVADVAGYHEGS